MDNLSRLDFTGQQIYVGMDVHKKSWSISILTDQFEHKTFTQPPEAAVLANYLKRNFPGADYHSVYEAGYSGFWIHDRLKAHGINCKIVNPADVPTKDKERKTKTDRVDCRKLARCLRNGDIRGIYVPSRAKAEDRSLVRARNSMVNKQTRCKNQIKSLLCFYGIQIPEELVHSHWSKNFINWISKIRMERASGNLALKAYLDELLYIRPIIAGLNKNIRDLARTDDYRTNVHLLQSVPGIGILTAMTLLTELYDIVRFKSLDQLSSYVGLIPDTDSSGEKDNTTGITRRRNSMLRFMLIETAWVAVRKDPALLMAFNRLCKSKTKTKAIVQIARKLLNRIRYVLKNQKEYVPAVIK